MSPISRRRFIVLGGGAQIGLCGCLGVEISNPDLSIGLLIVNHSDEPQSVKIHIEDFSNNTILEKNHSVEADGVYSEDGIFTGGRFQVTVSRVNKSYIDTDEEYDFRGCTSARIVITITQSGIFRLGKQDECK